MALEQIAIVEAGLAILQEDGFEALSLRKIADALGVKTPALYWHVDSRAALYGLMAEHMFREAAAVVDPTLGAQDWLIAFGRSLHAVHMRRRDAASLVSSVIPSQAMRSELLVQTIDRLEAAGLSRSDAFVAQSAVLSLALGWSLFESNAAVQEVMSEAIDVPAGFDASLDALVGGLFARRRRSGAAAGAG
jgi:TetR/AcrR family tetracycline transcriptional repressor